MFEGLTLKECFKTLGIGLVLYIYIVFMWLAFGDGGYYNNDCGRYCPFAEVQAYGPEGGRR